MNAELKGHGISNLISGITGGVPNYLCYSSSVTYFKCNGGSKYVLLCTCLIGGVRTVRVVGVRTVRVVGGVRTVRAVGAVL